MDRRVFCVRPLCGGGAAAALHYDYAARTAWLDPVGDDLAPGAWAVCTTHAERLRVPSGWTLVDRRSPSTVPTIPAPQSRPRPQAGYRPPLAV